MVSVYEDYLVEETALGEGKVMALLGRLLRITESSVRLALLFLSFGGLVTGITLHDHKRIWTHSLFDRPLEICCFLKRAVLRIWL